jgi:predicted unusual protein kinase regulating ubiquinone biosynthesis (AarF/ABC1/UbiB family)
MNHRPVTKGRRLLRLASMTAQVAGGYAKSRIKSVFQTKEAAERDRKSTHERSGEVIARTLGELKGAVMKVGQMASIARDVLPRELSEALGTRSSSASIGCRSLRRRSARCIAHAPTTGARSW